MPPLADFVCNHKACRMKNGAAKVYELPIKATHCPMGHKRIVRLYNKIAVIRRVADDRMDPRHTSSRHAARTDALVEQPVIQALQKRDELTASQRRAAGPPGTRWDGDMGLVKAVRSRALPAALGEVYGGGRAPIQMTPADMGKATPGLVPPESVGPVQGAGVPTDVRARDTEFRVRRTKHADGTVSVEGERAS